MKDDEMFRFTYDTGGSVGNNERHELHSPSGNLPH